MTKKKVLLAIAVSFAIIICVDFWWTFKDYWWHWFFILGYGGIGWVTALWISAEIRLEDAEEYHEMYREALMDALRESREEIKALRRRI